MSLPKLAIFGIGLLLLTGCPEARFGSARTVSLSLAVPPGQTKIVLSTADAQVQEALRLIDSVLVSNRFVPDPKRPPGSEPDLVASYAKFNESGLREIGTPSVYLTGHQLEVVVSEIGNKSARLSESSRQLCAALQKRLSARFGAERVRVAKAN